VIGMRRYALASLLAFCLHCGGQTQAAPPIEEAPLPAAEEPAAAAPAPEETSAPATEAPPPAETTAPAASAKPPKRPCSELDKTTCKITQGCLWNELKKCVDEGP
jgi:hypothetical protein